MHELPKLPYSYDALAGYPDLQAKPLEGLLENLAAVPESARTEVRHHGGGHYNHSFFWRCMGPNAGGEPAGKLAKAITQIFGTFPQFHEAFGKAATRRFGSGWVWLTLSPAEGIVQDGSGKLSIMTTQNQDAPISAGLRPLLCLDMWEYAYYLKYQNRRPEYVAAWWHVVN